MESELFTAIADNNFDKIKELIENGANVNSRNEDGYTPLMCIWICSSTPDIEIAKYLITEGGADVNAKDNDGYTALIVACQGYTEVYVELNESEKEKCFEFIKLLIDNGADIDAKNNDGYTSLYYGDAKIVKLLLDSGADVNNGGNEAFISACQSGDFEIVKLLFDKGLDIDINKQYYNGYTALSLACDEGNSKLVKLLLEKGADVNIKDNEGKTALSYARKAEIAKLLIENGAEDLESKLFDAIKANDFDKVKTLIDKGANVNAEDEYGYTALI